MRCPTTEFFLCGRSSKTFLLASLSGERCSGGQLLSTFSDLAGGLVCSDRSCCMMKRFPSNSKQLSVGCPRRCDHFRCTKKEPDWACLAKENHTYSFDIQLVRFPFRLGQRMLWEELKRVHRFDDFSEEQEKKLSCTTLFPIKLVLEIVPGSECSFRRVLSEEEFFAGPDHMFCKRTLHRVEN